MPTVIRREHFCNKLKELGYRYKRETDRVSLWKKPGNPSFVTVPRRDLVDEDYVRATLRMSGCNRQDIETFITTNRVP